MSTIVSKEFFSNSISCIRHVVFEHRAPNFPSSLVCKSQIGANFCRSLWFCVNYGTSEDCPCEIDPLQMRSRALISKHRCKAEKRTDFVTRVCALVLACARQRVCISLGTEKCRLCVSLEWRFRVRVIVSDSYEHCRSLWWLLFHLNIKRGLPFHFRVKLRKVHGPCTKTAWRSLLWNW